LNLYKSHPVFESPGDDAVLWRYCDLPKLVSLLSKKALHFSVASALGDHFEGAMTRELAAWMPRDVLPAIAPTRHQTFVSCWHENEYESAAMWQLYSRLNEGIAIRSTFSRVASSFVGFSLLPKALPPPNEIFAGRVNYIDYERDRFVDRSRALNALSLIVHKRMSFAHEREVRAVCSIPANCGRHSSNPLHKGIYVDCDLGQLIECVYISPSAPGYFCEAVADVCRRFSLGSRTLQSDLLSKPLY
jgi:hypothetical protein